MPAWDLDYFNTLSERFERITDGLPGRIADITEGRSAPSLDEMSLGTGRHVQASVLFFDICGFTQRTARDDLEALGETLYMLDCVIPMVMHVVFDYGGYIEKNTGDGVMALIGIGETPEDATTKAVDIAVVSLYVIDKLVNPHLVDEGIDPVDVSFGIDYGSLLLARIGTRRGTAKVVRSHITAVGPTANIAFALQEHAGAGEVLVGDLIYDHSRKKTDLMNMVTIADWAWTIGTDSRTYYAWEYTGRRMTL
jgi:class 3 adenylate cyclase